MGERIHGNPKYKTQVGSPYQCGRKDCKSTPTRRIGLGRFVVQVYVCTKHTVWGLNLDDLTQDTGEALGFHHGHPSGGGSLELRHAWVDTTLARVSSSHYDSAYLTRDEAPRISALWPDEKGDYHPPA